MRKHILLTLTLVCAMPAMQMFASCSSDCKPVCPADDCVTCDDCDDCDCHTFSRTFFTVRPQYQSASPEKVSLFREREYAREDGKGGAFQLTVFGGRSTRSGKLRNYFFPKCKTSLTVKEENGYLLLFGENPLDSEVDIIGRNFRILTVNGHNKLNQLLIVRGQNPNVPLFESTITMCPRQSVFGIGLTWRQNLTKLMNQDDSEEKDFEWWFEISSPLTRVKNNLNFKETIVEEAGGVFEGEIAGLDEDHKFFGSMEEAFKQKAWKYGKICGAQTKWRLADIELKLGWEWKSECMCRLESYVGVLIPTGNRPTAEFMFEPIVGHNKHFGIMKGGAACFKIWEDEEEGKAVRVAIDMHAMYLFKKCEKRSFDLKCKPWSRYLEVYGSKEEATKAEAAAGTLHGSLLASPGINFFTKDLEVKPRLSCNATSALVYTNDEKGFKGEFGYNCYCRQKECVKLACDWNEVVALKSQLGDGGTAPFASIDNRGSYFHEDPRTALAGDFSQIFRQWRDGKGFDASVIKESDLDLESAAHPAAFSHTFYLAMSKQWDDRDYPLFLGGGFSYEFGSDNTAMSRWLAWIKGGVSF